MEKVQFILMAAVPLLFSVSFHEAAHAWTADRLGDPTARFMGRVTLNPLPHIDIFGTLVFPLIVFFSSGMIWGWAKPVPVNERNLRKPLRDGLLVAAAGPVSNLILALAGTFVLAVLVRAVPADPFGIMRQAVLPMISFGIFINVLLAVFNSLPIPPLDGSRIFVGLFPGSYPLIAKLERYSFIFFVVLLLTGAFAIIVGRPSRLIYDALMGIAL